jgi:ketosteroid isomerase-like protein
MPRSRVASTRATSNLEIVASTYDALNRGDIAGWLEPLDPAVEVTDRMNGVIAHSREQYRRWINGYLESWQSYREILERIEAVGDQVVALVKSQACGAASGMVIEECHGEVHTLRDGRIVAVFLYPTYKEALQAVGLEA